MGGLHHTMVPLKQFQYNPKNNFLRRPACPMLFRPSDGPPPLQEGGRHAPITVHGMQRGGGGDFKGGIARGGGVACVGCRCCLLLLCTDARTAFLHTLPHHCKGIQSRNRGNVRSQAAQTTIPNGLWHGPRTPPHTTSRVPVRRGGDMPTTHPNSGLLDATLP